MTLAEPQSTPPVVAAAVEPAWKIAAVSAIVLILELALIRQIPAEVRVVSYFTNLVLMACFFGLGLGCILQQRRDLEGLLPLGLLSVVAFVLYGRGVVIYDEARSVHFWLQYAEIPAQARRIPLFPAAVAAFVSAAIPFVALGQTLARRMDQHPRVVAYAWDIAGSLGGTLLFVATSALGMPPWWWPPLLMAAWALVCGRHWGWRVTHVAAGLAFVAFAQSPLASQWSPYYLVQHRVERLGVRVWVNSSFHQMAIDFSAGGDPVLQDAMRRKWSWPYEVYRKLHGGRSPARVLVLGAGTGNDVVVALDSGAREVVAVEIDPTILELGQRSNPRQPYADPRVRTVVDDARHFLRATSERFDLVVFGTLDSQALLSGHANLRLENYVYTVEALRDARDVLAERGLTAIFYSVFRPWLLERAHATVREAFGDQVLLRREEDQRLFNTTILAARDLPELAVAAAGTPRPTGLVSTDDWPFLYLERPTIAPVYLQILGVVVALVIGAFVLLRRIHPVTGLHADFLLLGLAFSLLEAAAVVRLALLFGSTWVVNAAVFASVLATIFVGNLAVMRGWAPRLFPAFFWLCASVLVNWALPLPWLLDLAPLLRAGAAGLAIGLPVFFAACCFSRLFAEQQVTGYPLGVNLVGAMAGGVLEYASMLIGLRAVWLIVLLLYMLAAAFAWRTRSPLLASAARP